MLLINEEEIKIPSTRKEFLSHVIQVPDPRQAFVK